MLRPPQDCLRRGWEGLGPPWGAGWHVPRSPRVPTAVPPIHSSVSTCPQRPAPRAEMMKRGTCVLPWSPGRGGAPWAPGPRAPLHLRPLLAQRRLQASLLLYGSSPSSNQKCNLSEGVSGPLISTADHSTAVVFWAASWGDSPSDTLLAVLAELPMSPQASPSDTACRRGGLWVGVGPAAAVGVSAGPPAEPRGIHISTDHPSSRGNVS